MAVTINKTKSKPKAKAAVKTSTKHQMAILVDEMGELDDKIRELQVDLEPLAKKYAQCQSELLEITDDILAADQTNTVSGEVYEADLSAKSNATTITDMKKIFELFKAMEGGVVFDLMKFNIGDIRKYLTPPQIEKVTKTERSGKRTVKISKLL